MPDFEGGTLALGLIFEYENPVTESSLKGWLEENEFDFIDQEAQQSLNISPQGMKVEGEEGIAKKDDINILYQASANIKGFSDVSFITVKNTERVEFDNVLSTVDDILNWLGELEIADDIISFELTIQGLVRIANGATLTKYFTDDALDLTQAIGGYEAEGLTVRLQSKAKPSSNDWYRVLFDGDAAGNPHLWGLNISTRYENVDEISENRVFEPIDEFIDYTMDS